MVEDSHGEGDLCELLVSHHAIRLESAVLCRTHTREVYAVFGSPVMFLEVAQMVSHHRYVSAPLFLQTDEHAHSDRMYTGLSHTVEAVATPVEVSLHSTRVVNVVMRSVIGLLEADDAVHSMMGELGVILCGERHHLEFEVREVLLGDVESLREIRHAGLYRVLSGDYQQVLERGQFLYRLVLVLALFRCQNYPRHRVGRVESAIYAMIYARVSYIERNEHRHGLSESLLRVFAAERSHGFEIRLGGRGDQCHDILHVAVLFSQSASYVPVGLGRDLGGRLVPIYFCKFICKHSYLLYSSFKKAVSGELASAINPLLCAPSPASNAILPASTAFLKATAIASGSPATAIAVFTRQADAPISIASAA